MPIIEKGNTRILFVHIPKNGGTTIERWLGKTARLMFYDEYPPPIYRVSPQHLPVSILKRLFGDGWWHYSFALIRNPYARAESEYFYRIKMGDKGLPDFSSWLIENINSTKENPFHMDNHFQTQTYFIDKSVEIYRLEDGLDSIVSKISAMLGIPGPSSNSKDNLSEKSEVIWSGQAVEIFNSFYGADFSLFGYPMKT